MQNIQRPGDAQIATGEVCNPRVMGSYIVKVSDPLRFLMGMGHA
jgi:hypothetical protein